MTTNDTFDYKTPYGDFGECRFRVSRYLDNGNLALLICASTDPQTVIATVTVNPYVSLDDDRIAVKDYSENAGMVDFLVKMGIIEPKPLKLIGSGFVDIPIHMLTESGLELFKEA